jgi:hypothetical protein
MTLSPPPRAEVYLVENRLNPISTRAALELTDDNLRCTVKAFDFRRDQLKIKVAQAIFEGGLFR